MRGWDLLRWVSDEDGLRCYFSEPEPRGLSRLECYRRLLGQPDATQLPAARPLNSGGPRVARLRRLADVLDLGGRNRRVHG